MNIPKLSALCGLAAAALVFIQPAQAELVYNNSTTLTGSFTPGVLEVGDEIILGGNGRTVTNFTFQYSGSSFGGNEQARLRFYRNDGVLTNGFASPGSVLYDSGSFALGASPTGSTLIFDDFGAWNGVVPNSFTWSVQFSNLGGGAVASVSLFNPVTVGGNYDDYWENNGGWSLKQGGSPINFGATVQAVPEPSTIVLGVIGAGACLLGYRRRRN